MRSRAKTMAPAPPREQGCPNVVTLQTWEGRRYRLDYAPPAASITQNLWLCRHLSMSSLVAFTRLQHSLKVVRLAVHLLSVMCASPFPTTGEEVMKTAFCTEHKQLAPLLLPAEMHAQLLPRHRGGQAVACFTSCWPHSRSASRDRQVTDKLGIGIGSLKEAASATNERRESGLS